MDSYEAYAASHCDGSAHWDVAAYALGVLALGEVAHVEQHLAECPACADELDQLLPASMALAELDPADLPELDQPELFDRLAAEVTADRLRTRHRRRLAVAATGVLAAATAVVGLVAGAFLVSPGPTRVASDPPPTLLSPNTDLPGIGGPDLAGAERFTATDPDTGVRADALLERHDWGTHLTITMWGLSGPRECQLLLVNVAGDPEVAATWRVPGEGYGTDAQPAPLTLPAATATAREQLVELRVRSLTPGDPTVLVNVPF